MKSILSLKTVARDSYQNDPSFIIIFELSVHILNRFLTLNSFNCRKNTAILHCNICKDNLRGYFKSYQRDLLVFQRSQSWQVYCYISTQNIDT